MEAFMSAMCLNFPDDKYEQSAEPEAPASAASASPSQQSYARKMRQKMTFGILSKEHRQIYRASGLPWKLPDNFVYMLGKRMSEVESAMPDDSTAPASALKLRKFKHTGFVVESFHRPTIQRYLDSIKYLTTTQKSAVLASSNKEGLSAIQGPPGTGKTELIAHISILAALSYVCNYSKEEDEECRKLMQNMKPQILIVCATNSAADHVAEQVSRLKDELISDDNFFKRSEALQKSLPTSGKCMPLGQIKIMRKYAASYSAAEVPHQLWYCSNKNGMPYHPKDINVTIMTIGHAKGFKFLALYAPQLVVFEEASMTNFFEMFGVLCRAVNQEARENMVDSAHQRRKANDGLPLGSKNQHQRESDDDGMYLIDDDEDIVLGEVDQDDDYVPKNKQHCTSFLMNFRIFRRLAGSVHDCFMKNLPMRCKTMLVEVFRGHRGLYDFNFGMFYNQHQLQPSFLPRTALEYANDCPQDFLLSTFLSDHFQNHKIVVIDVNTFGPTSCRSETEAFLARRIVNKLSAGGVEMTDIAVITPYKSQLLQLFKVFVVGTNETSAASADFLCPCTSNPELIVPLDRRAYSDLKVGTVDAAQGKEFDYVIASFGRNNTSTLGFLADSYHPTLQMWKNGRVNVMFSRHRKALIVLCDAASFLKNTLLTNTAPEGSEAVEFESSIEAGRFMPYTKQSFMVFLKEARHEGLIFDAKNLQL
ncbi:hypothetical protein niasHS_012718 [Heterodera schachtii]|uniref:Uncharacterized protein n=1 Tax=Heterodera schachtii TaxID=97005 RepID=A0ABD2IT45_HETSC